MITLTLVPDIQFSLDTFKIGYFFLTLSVPAIHGLETIAQHAIWNLIVVQIKG